MDHFSYHNGSLHAEDVPLADIAAQFGTPCYVYSRATLERHWQVFDAALGTHPHLVLIGGCGFPKVKCPLFIQLNRKLLTR